MNIYDGHVERGCRPGTTAACAKRWAGSRSHTSALRPARLISDVARPAAPPASTLTNHASGEPGTLLLPGGGHRATRAGCGSRVAESKKNTHTHTKCEDAKCATCGPPGWGHGSLQSSVPTTSRFHFCQRCLSRTTFACCHHASKPLCHRCEAFLAALSVGS